MVEPHEQLEQKKKQAVLSSKKFQLWWIHRKETGNIPMNPYQAYAIDVSLAAKPATKLIDWQHRPNQSDLLGIDYPEDFSQPFGQQFKQHKTQSKQERKQEREANKSQELPRKGPEREIMLATEKLATKFGTPAPRFYQDPARGTLTSYARVGAIRLGKDLYGNSSTPQIHVGTANKNSFAHQFAAAAHETGHTIHAQATLKGKISGIQAMGFNMAEYSGDRASRSATYADELAAWKLGQPMLDQLPAKGQRPAGNWLKKYALNTYKNKPKQVIRLPEGGLEEIWK